MLSEFTLQMHPLSVLKSMRTILAGLPFFLCDQMNLTWDEPANRGGGEGVFVPMSEYDVVISMGVSLAGLPSAHRQSFSVPEGRSYIRQIDSRNAKEYRMIQGLRKGMVYYVYIRARNSAIDTDGNSDWSDGAIQSNV